MVDLLDFGGKYLYLWSLYHTHIRHELVLRTAYYVISIGLGFVTLLIAALLYSPLGRTKPPNPRGCRRYGREGDFRPVQDSTSSETDTQSTLSIRSIWLFPIKSCAGQQVDSAEITDEGLKYDRRFTFAQLHSPFPLSLNDSQESKSAHEWRFITQREFPLLSQVRTELWIPDSTLPGYDASAEHIRSGGVVVVSFPYEEDGFLGRAKSLLARIRGQRSEMSFLLPFQPTDAQQKSYTTDTVRIWKDTVTALDMGRHLPPELKYFLGVRNPFTIFRSQHPRPVFRNAPRKEKIGYQPGVGFADAYPINMLGTSSLQAVSEMQPESSPPLTFARFRANLALAGSSPFQEETWTKIRIAGMVFHVCCRCVRCQIPNINPVSAVSHRREPLKTLKSERNVDPGARSEGCLAVQMVPDKPEGTIRVGDILEVLELGDTVYIPM